MTVKGLRAKTKSTDFPTNLRVYAMVILILHSHCYIGEAWGSDTLPPHQIPHPPNHTLPALHRAGYCPSQRLQGSQAICSPPIVLAFPGQSPF